MAGELGLSGSMRISRCWVGRGRGSGERFLCSLVGHYILRDEEGLWEVGERCGRI